jgi:hypothetical protein
MDRARRIGAAAAAAVLLVTGLGAAPASAEQVTASGLLAALPVATDSGAPYDRSLFGEWVDADGDGCDTRSEVLQAESTAPVTLNAGCTVATGSWTSPYDGAVWTSASDVDIDHMVPLAEAWRSGASAWTAAQRAAYANDVDFGPALQAVTDDVNQAKSDRDPSAWLPPAAGAHCAYAVDWVATKWRWRLAVDGTEASTLGSLLAGTCGQTVVEVTRAVAETPAPAPTDRLRPSQTLTAGQQLTSPNGAYRLTLQPDGNLVLYPATGRALWSTRTAGSGATRLVLQPDGNVVLYPTTGRAVWSTRTAASGGVELRVQDDGNLVLYPAAGRAVWSTGTAVRPVTSAAGDRMLLHQQLTAGQSLTSPNGRYRFTMQPDGNAVVYAPNNRALWSSRSAGKGGSRVVLQQDGNLVIYPAVGGAVWSTGTAGRGGVRLTIQDDGNLVLYPATGRALWSTGADKPVTPPPNPGPTQPPNPGDSKNCTHFATQAQAQAWFDTYYPWYGDVAQLDSDGDLIACETLP